MSKRFKFSAEMLLKLRRRREEAVRRRFARVTGEVQTITRRVVRLREALRMHNDALQRMLPGGADAMNIRLYRQCIDDIGQVLAADNKRLAEAEKVLGKRRAQLLDAAGQRKVLGVMKDRQKAAHAGADRRQEAREQDLINAGQVVAKETLDHKAAV